MKKKFLSVLFALVLVLSFSLVTAVPVAAATIDLAVNDENPWTDGAFTFKNISPGGDPMAFDFKLHNVGDDPGILTFSMNYVENDMAGAPYPNMSADEFASLIYVEDVHYQFKWPADPEKQPEGYIGAVQPDLPNWMAIDEFLGNDDGYVSLYEICQAGTIHYDVEDDPLVPTAEITYFIEFQLGDSLEPFQAGGDILTGVEDNSLQGDGISVTITATLGTDVEESSGNVFQAAGVAGPVENVDTSITYGTIQPAIDDPETLDTHTISVAAGTYNLTAPIVVDKSVTLTGDVSTPSNVVINASGISGDDRDGFQVKTDNVTIQGFKMQGAQDAAGSQNCGVVIGTHWVGEPIAGLHTIDISHNEFLDCSKGIFMWQVKDSTVTYNTFTTTEGQVTDNFFDEVGWGGDAVHVYLSVASDYPTGNTISYNTMDNVRVGVFLNGDTISGTDPSAWNFSGTTISHNIMTNVWNAGIVLQCASGTAASPIEIEINDIDISTGRRAGDEGNERGLISVHGDYTVITGNILTGSEEHGLWVDGSHHMVTGNIVASNTKDGIHVGAYKKTEPVHGWTLPVITRADITIQTNTVENVGAVAAAISGRFIVSIDILGNIINDFVKGGIVVKDVLSVQIEGNIISTTNYSAAPNGIQVGYSFPSLDPTPTTGTVKGNQVSGCHWSGYDPTQPYEGATNWTGSGILVIAPHSGLEISENEVQSCDVGLDIEADSGTLITNNDVHDNSYGFVLWNANPTISFNNIYQNALYGVYRTFDLTGILNAINNYWGNASGPIPPGTYDSYGDKVSANVEYEPWLLEEQETATAYDKTLALKDGWTLISVDKAVTEPIWVGTNPLYALKYTPTGGFVSDVTPADLQPLTAIYVKTDGGGGVGFNYAADGGPAFYSKELEAGWNLISIPDMGGPVAIYDILSPLRYVTIGTQQGVGLTTLVSQGDYNQFSPSFYEATLTEADWIGLPHLSRFDGYWANMEGAETFEVPIP